MFNKNKQYRLFGYDYAHEGFYFVTIVTKDRLHHFGEIRDNDIHYFVPGLIAKEHILKFYSNPELENPYENNPLLDQVRTNLTGITE